MLFVVVMVLMTMVVVVRLVPEPLSYLRELRYLNLSRNRISKCSSLRNLNALNFLDLSHNSLKVLPDDFLVGAHQIKHLNLSHNALMHIPQQMFSLATLLDLNLSHNAIVNLPDRVCELVAIRNLDLSYNRLNELPEKKLISMINLTTLNIRHNLIYLPQRFHLITDASIVLQFLSVSQFTVRRPCRLNDFDIIMFNTTVSRAEQRQSRLDGCGGRPPGQVFGPQGRSAQEERHGDDIAHAERRQARADRDRVGLEGHYAVGVPQAPAADLAAAAAVGRSPRRSCTRPTRRRPADGHETQHRRRHHPQTHQRRVGVEAAERLQTNGKESERRAWITKYFSSKGMRTPFPIERRT